MGPRQHVRQRLHDALHHLQTHTATQQLISTPLFLPREQTNQSPIRLASIVPFVTSQRGPISRTVFVVLKRGGWSSLISGKEEMLEVSTLVTSVSLHGFFFFLNVEIKLGKAIICLVGGSWREIRSARLQPAFECDSQAEAHPLIQSRGALR